MGVSTTWYYIAIFNVLAANYRLTRKETRFAFDQVNLLL